MLKAS